ncbi:MAG: helix-turn-helix domain-containing protein [Ekhidna sp.]|uniref:helix-turn-helix domain-containing protein n=1 Tax=Ekhidna sp. TaxID=2608089 RepID=UPI003299D069
MAATIITTEDLREFKLELIDEIRQLLSNDNTNSKQWLRSTELRKLLKISPGTLQNLRVNGTIPYTKIGGVIYYDYEDILKMIEDNKFNSEH